MSKEKVILDSCVFFGMMKYNNYFETYGKTELNKYLEAEMRLLNKLRDDTLSLMNDVYKQKNKDLNFMDLVDGYKAYAKSVARNYEKQIESKKMLIKGNVFDKQTQSMKKVEISAERKNKLQFEINEMTKFLEGNREKLNRFLELKIKYKNRRDSVMTGKIYQMILNGTVEPYVTYTSYKEILNHTGERKPEMNSNYLLFSEKQTKDLLKHCTLINFMDEKVVNLRFELARKFRTSTKDNQVTMDNDVNSVGEYGDSQIIAEANLAGIILVTNNTKDFIKFKGSIQKGGVQENDLIRKHIINVCENSKECTDAYVYSPEEFLQGNYIKPTKQSEVVKLSNVIESKRDFIGEVELEVF